MNITVVGAGVVGCAVAHELARRGARVRVLDARGPGLGATRASAGMLAPYIEGHLPELRSLGVRSLAMFDDFIARVVADSGEAVEYERTGTLEVARSEEEATILCAAARALAAAGVRHVVLDGPAARQLEAGLAPDIIGALQVPDHGYVAAAALTRALAAAAVKHGADIVTARVAAIEGGDRPRVVTANGGEDSDAVVIAAGSWSDGLSGRGETGSGPAVKPIRGQLLQLRASTRPAARVIWGNRCYVVPWRDGSVLAGATVEDVGFDETATAAGVRHLLEASAELLPALRGATLEEVRVGLRPMTHDELPAVGPSSTMRNVFYATGHYRNGVLLAPLTAALAADVLLDGGHSPELALVRPERLGL